MRTLMDNHLHRISLDIALAFKEYYAKGDMDTANELLTAYRNVRRHISKDVDGKRYGAQEAHEAMQM